MVKDPKLRLERPWCLVIRLRVHTPSHSHLHTFTPCLNASRSTLLNEATTTIQGHGTTAGKAKQSGKIPTGDFGQSWNRVGVLSRLFLNHVLPPSHVRAPRVHEPSLTMATTTE